MLKAIIFDLDDTLLWDRKSIAEAFRTTCEKAAEKVTVDPEKLEERVRAHAEALYPTFQTYEFVSNIGIGTFEGMWGEFLDDGEDFKRLRETVPLYRKQAWFKGLQDVGIEDEKLAEELAKVFPEERKKHVFLYDETIDVLESLKEKYKLIMLTNGSPHLQNTKLSLSPELRPYFDHIVISDAFGKGKPAVEMFPHAVELANVDKAEAIMIGDNPNTDILGACRIGMDSIWINHDDTELEDVTPTYEVSRLREILPLIEERSQQL